VALARASLTDAESHANNNHRKGTHNGLCLGCTESGLPPSGLFFL